MLFIGVVQVINRSLISFSGVDMGRFILLDNLAILLKFTTHLYKTVNK